MVIALPWKIFALAFVLMFTLLKKKKKNIYIYIYINIYII